MLPIGARTMFRALRTRAASQIGADWVWPWWLERQLDPGSPAFVPRGHLPFLTNLTARNWTAIGNLDSPLEAIVDPRGLVTPWFDGWSLDWWIGADDRWHFPSQGGGGPPAPRGRRAGGGDRRCASRAVTPSTAPTPSVPRPTTVRTSWRSWRSRTSSAVPFAVALRRAARTTRRGSPSSSGSSCTTTPRSPSTAGSACCCPRRPPRMAASTFHAGDSAHHRGRRPAPARDFPAIAKDEAGMAQAAFVYPLPHGATLRVAVPLLAEHRTRRRGLTRRRVRRAPPLPVGRARRRPRSPTGGRRRPAEVCGSTCPTPASPKRSTPTAASCSLLHDPRRDHARARRRTTGSGSATPPTWWPPSTATGSTTRRPTCSPATPGASASTASSSASARSGTPTAPRCGPWPSTGASLATMPLLEPMVRRHRQGRPLDRAQAPDQAPAARSPSSPVCCRPASRPSTSARSTTSTGTTSGAWPACASAADAARRRSGNPRPPARSASSGWSVLGRRRGVAHARPQAPREPR